MTSLSQKSINNSLTRANSAEIAGFAMPDYTAGIVLTNNATNTFDSDGFVLIRSASGNGSGYISLSAGSERICFAYLAGSYNTLSYSQVAVSKGDYYLENSNTSYFDAVFYPVKGAL